MYELSRWLYDHPEVSNQEQASSQRVADELVTIGFDVERDVFGEPTGFIARTGSGGPEVIVCAEYDALPAVGHACGHNIIAAAAVGTGAALIGLADRLKIRLTVLGTPAEEQTGAKVGMLEQGAFADAVVAMMIHPSTRDVVDPMMIAIAELGVTYRGRAAHASAHPQLGLNALDAFVQAYVAISTLRQSMYPTDKVHGIIDHGGDAPNIIPEMTHSSWYVRAQNRHRLDELTQRVTACFEAAGMATGCSVEIQPIGNVYDELATNPRIAEFFAENSARLGRPMRRGADIPNGQAGSTDMGNVSQVVPTIHPMLDLGSYPAVNHQREFADHTITSTGQRVIRDGALAMAWTIIDLAIEDCWDDL